MALFLSALGHDIDHPGTTNDFQTQVKSKISIKYLDESNIEMNSIHLLFKILLQTKITNSITEKKENIFINFSKDEISILREFIIICILRTDPRFHSHFIEMFSHHKEQREKDKTVVTTFNLRKLEVKDADSPDPVEVFIFGYIY